MAFEGEIAEVAENEFYSAAYHRFISQGRLVGSECSKCGARHLPPRPICPQCHAREAKLVEVKGDGKLVAYTVIMVGSPLMVEEGFDREHPYCSGVVELAGGLRVTARILGVDVLHPDRIKIGTPLVAEYQQRVHSGEKETFLAFRAVSSGQPLAY